MINKEITANCRSKEENAFSKIRQILTDSVVDMPMHRGDCAITDEEAFQERLSTFTSFNWSCKPKQISPPKCAQFGWRVVEKDLMQCTSCKQFLSAQVPPVWKVDRYLEATRLVEKSLKGSHHQFCPWSSSPSHDNYLHCKLLQQGKAVEGFGQRLASLKEISHCLPHLAQNSCEDLGFLQDDCKAVSQLTHDLGDEVTYNSVILALTGWKKVKENISITRINCDYCFRIVELSTYVSSKKDQDVPIEEQSISTEGKISDEADDAPVRKRLKKCEDRPFHPLEQHQSWCPWLQVISDECPKEAWRLLLDIIRIDVSRTSSTSEKNVVALRQGVLHIKKIIKDWIVECSK